MKLVYYVIVLSASLTCSLFAQLPEKRNFQEVVEGIIKTRFERATLATVCPMTDPTSARVFADYGAIFVARGVRLPGSCIFQTEEMVQSFQSQADPVVANIGGVQVTLQRAAMTALLAARQEALKKGLAITPRGGSDASTRSYTKTLALWRTRLNPGLKYWVRMGRIKRKEAVAAQSAPIGVQVAMVLAWEDKKIYFSQGQHKSILYSVAIPGASQHIFMLALDVQQYANKQVRQILAEHGWFQTVKSDLPHFTYLGGTEKDLQSRGLMPVEDSGQTFWIPNMKKED